MTFRALRALLTFLWWCFVGALSGLLLGGVVEVLRCGMELQAVRIETILLFGISNALLLLFFQISHALREFVFVSPKK